MTVTDAEPGPTTSPARSIPRLVTQPASRRTLRAKVAHFLATTDSCRTSAVRESVPFPKYSMKKCNKLVEH
jgi:hypothetical protein